MDQIKIGQFIAKRRKMKNMTQAQLAEALGITDRAVSKWETGRSLPDAGIMLELCSLLEISVNELLSGEELEMTNYNEMAEKNLLEMKKQKEESDKRLLKTEILIGFVSALFLFAMIGVGTYIEYLGKPLWIFWILYGVGMAQFLAVAFLALRIEQKAGYYECQKCHHRYVPGYFSVFFAMHVNRTRYMRCPECGKRSWQKKVLSDTPDE
ncbi:MAG: helix-turn-helix domain-containing protein [Clostridiales bacterium]|nr:helix-turn-helix domain-containing protein [Clostridiales bacterium]